MLKGSKLRILRLKEVRELTGVSRSAIYQRMKEGSFPKTIQLGPNSVGWVEGEIEDWIVERIENRDSSNS